MKYLTIIFLENFLFDLLAVIVNYQYMAIIIDSKRGTFAKNNQGLLLHPEKFRFYFQLSLSGHSNLLLADYYFELVDSG
jgi:hypothetical protein